MKEFELDDVADLADPPLPRDNSRVHVSSLVNRAAKLVGLPSYSDEEPTRAQRNIMALGRLWEAMVRPAVESLAGGEGLEFQAQGVWEVDDVIGSLDGILVESGLTYAVVEIKTRWSNAGDPRDNWRWMAQVKGYCFMAMCRRAWMPVLYLPRRGPPDAEFQLHKLEFQPHELAENWQMLMGARKKDDNTAR
jgi:hypothetical protein